ncbi:hypothetical protein PVAR5_8875 [Paecilomyces variotii No. 5]|uniref:Uncharacterized protein n=1 Tax=Byssochlamys spectabilis (strain No. 5 / NBRC 109023) TaxID=1356009 RepID=V5G6N5_BYSSN|nr:hypothetical protein PVAR5_8875 [Paecilomyces variotii No. 5]
MRVHRVAVNDLTAGATMRRAGGVEHTSRSQQCEEAATRSEELLSTIWKQSREALRHQEGGESVPPWRPQEDRATAGAREERAERMKG